MGTEKRYSKDWAKAKSRKIVKDSIEYNLLPNKSPEDIHVLCFPGFDAAEIHQIYDPIGIPRSNIVGVERDPDIANALEAQSLGIQIVRGSLEEYIASQKWIQFDVVSLDYTGPISSTQLETLQEIVTKQRRKQFVLQTANLLKRDKFSAPLYHIGFSQASYDPDFEEQENLESRTIGHLYQKSVKWIEFNEKKENGDSLLHEKKISYGRIIELTYSNNRAEDGNRLLKFALGPHYETVLSELEETYGVSIDRTSPFSTPIRSDSPPVQFLLEAVTQAGLQNILSKLGIENESHQAMLTMILEKACKSESFFVPLDSTTYSYISETGSPMIGGVSFLVYPFRARNLARHISRMIGFDLGYASEPNDKERFASLVVKYLDRLADLYTPERLQQLKRSQLGVQFLGSSAKPVLTKGRAIQEFKEGASVDDLKGKYRAWEEKPLAQWKAHVTMGTYEGEHKEGLDRDFEEDAEIISKEEAIDLLLSNVPIEEIYNAYPTSFTKKQLGAFKAHITMGKYK